MPRSRPKCSASSSTVSGSLADYLQEKFGEPMGAGADATWLIDRAGQEDSVLLP